MARRAVDCPCPRRAARRDADRGGRGWRGVPPIRPRTANSRPDRDAVICSGRRGARAHPARRRPAVRIGPRGPRCLVTGAGPPGASSSGSSRGRVQTVLGPIDPGELGWVLPHEHTAIALWHIANRWDYWELRRDEPVIREELAAFRAAGGASVVDLTVDGVGRDPGWLARLARATGLHIVMGSGWYRDAYYPPEVLVDRRSVDALADLIVRDATVGVGETGVRSGI